MEDKFIGKVYTLQDTLETFNFRGYDIPVHLMKLTGGGADTFERIAIEHLKILSELVGLSSEQVILEIGCGIGRDAIPLTEIISTRGSYIGIDIYKKSIDWCIKNISEKNKSFKFNFWDIKDEWFNPEGLRVLNDFKIEASDNSVDRIFLQSVFTHLLESDIQYYFNDFSRILKGDGKIYATFFIVDKEIISSQSTSSYITFNHEVGPGVWVHDLSQPAIAVAYTIDTLEKMAANSGLHIDRVVYGCWSGRSGEIIGGQDSVVLSKKNIL
jgi:ubiquinone/menaquinone biosynthesis C-methylase UbiE